MDQPLSRWWFQLFCIFTLLPGEMIQFDQHIFQMGWFNHQPRPASLPHTDRLPNRYRRHRAGSQRFKVRLSHVLIWKYFVQTFATLYPWEVKWRLIIYQCSMWPIGTHPFLHAFWKLWSMPSKPPLLRLFWWNLSDWEVFSKEISTVSNRSNICQIPSLVNSKDEFLVGSISFWRYFHLQHWA